MALRFVLVKPHFRFLEPQSMDYWFAEIAHFQELAYQLLLALEYWQQILLVWIV